MKKPENSKIILHKADEILEINFPPSGFHNYLSIVIILIIMMAFFPLTLMGYGIYAADFPYKIVCGLFSIPFLVTAIGFGTILPPIFLRNVCLCIDAQQITITNKMLNFEPNISLVIQKQDIKELERTKRHIVIENPNTKYADSILREPDIIIRAGEEEYAFHSYILYTFSEPELDWLANELSNCLGLPITKN